MYYSSIYFVLCNPSTVVQICICDFTFSCNSSYLVIFKLGLAAL